MEKVDVMVIGASAAGLVASTTAKHTYPDARVLVVHKDRNVLVPCGIPYVFGTVGSTDKDLLPTAKIFENAGVESRIDEVTSIDREKKVCRTRGGDEINYDKLIIATGSTPRAPGWLNGSDLENVFTVPKDKTYLDCAQLKMNDLDKVVTIGGGFIGVEFSDELKKAEKDVTLVEYLPHVLGLVFDEEIATRVEDI
ncbi:MAG: pyridine nucleotide-disulfide oxidoreductase, partial [Candidatus Latescibacteria bacterium]|nr:pyridine nucleotide-disulfide oxidoreductase [bacterium]MBD3424954.1 pyridine nucleotide-disulfide oxidoreductase [Candidatus Latescibacterota bacterium]